MMFWQGQNKIAFHGFHENNAFNNAFWYLLWKTIVLNSIQEENISMMTIEHDSHILKAVGTE